MRLVFAAAMARDIAEWWQLDTAESGEIATALADCSAPVLSHPYRVARRLAVLGLITEESAYATDIDVPAVARLVGPHCRALASFMRRQLSLPLPPLPWESADASA